MWPYPKVVAHRGGGVLAPENTIAAFKMALEYGFYAVEFDAMLAKDGVPVLMHDAYFGRTIAGADSVAHRSSVELQGMDAGIWFGEAFAGEPVCTLAQAISFCKSNGIWMNIEIKPSDALFELSTGKEVGRMVQAAFANVVGNPLAHASALPLLSSFSYDALMAAKVAAPNIPRELLVDDIPYDWAPRLAALEAVALHVNHAHLTAELAAAVKAAGYGLFCYTVNDLHRAAEIMGWGVDGFCTDRIDLIGPAAF
jgi:glycerophosphoryl diester phosphodiesterase